MIVWFLGPRPLGPMGPFIFRVFSKMYFLVWDLSRSVPRVFRSPGNPLIKLSNFRYNSKCHFQKVILFIVLPIALPIELPIVLPIVLPIELPIESPSKVASHVAGPLLACYQKNTLFELFELLDAQKIGFGAWGRFCMFFYVQEFTDLFTVFAIFYKFWKMLHNSFSYEPSRQYGISPFLKTILKKSI